ncbi:MAG: hypothetical protein HGA53_05615, partial [Anaerolineaceae bacterium]|nr:hypothetical protein [Anaerolineaceae bacterium]
SQNGAPIDFVDIGLPTDNYDLDYIKADVDLSPISDIQKSPYVTPGIALGLGSKTIQPGQKGTVHLYITNLSGLVYPGTANESEKYASIQFSPNYFGSQYVQGNTKTTITIVLPPGMKETEPRYYQPQNWPGNSEPTSGIDKDGRVFYTWSSDNADGSTEYVFGAAFPARLIPAIPEKVVETRPAVTINQDDVFGGICFGGFGLFFILIIVASVIGSKNRKMKYLPPKIAIEGHGIKRGLTAIEAAVLMEQPLDKVCTMILFSTLKKGAAEVVTREPLAVKSVSPAPEGLYPYETEFLAAFTELKPQLRKKALQNTLVDLVKGLTEKMRGFSRNETIAYYKSIMERAWQQVEAANTPEVKSQVYDEVMGWTMLDKEFDTRTSRSFSSGPVILPNWWWRYDPMVQPAARNVGTSMAGAPSVAAGGTPIRIEMPTLPGADFAASMVSGIQNFSSNVIGDLTGFTGAVTNVTNPPPPPTSSRSGWSGGSGGHSCACACACAGCACACAGGGR